MNAIAPRPLLIRAGGTRRPIFTGLGPRRIEPRIGAVA